ncbi:hypothetical protein TIFTF001_049399 [Ficus carica]|uniref:Uncharacterized protein n=1 Tax=Ficus carica TaxID=3494 RepID=A0AA88CRY2_FICCA|nr:hypothetical protein TIFTF001_049399 [Ficus carica]
MDILPGRVGAVRCRIVASAASPPSAVRSTTGADGAWAALSSSSVNPRSGAVLGPTRKISSNRAAPVYYQLIGVIGSLGDRISEIPDKLSGVRPLGPVASPADDDLVLEVDAVLPVMSALSNKLTFSESDISLILTVGRSYYLLRSSRCWRGLSGKSGRISRGGDLDSRRFSPSRPKFEIQKFEVPLCLPTYRGTTRGTDGMRHLDEFLPELFVVREADQVPTTRMTVEQRTIGRLHVASPATSAQRCWGAYVDVIICSDHKVTIPTMLGDESPTYFCSASRHQPPPPALAGPAPAGARGNHPSVPYAELGPTWR